MNPKLCKDFNKMKYEGQNERGSFQQNLKVELDAFFDRINDALSLLTCECQEIALKIRSNSNEPNENDTQTDGDLDNKELLENFETIIQDLKRNLTNNACKCSCGASHNSSDATFCSLSECSDDPREVPVVMKKRLTLLEQACLHPLTLADLFPREIIQPSTPSISLISSLPLVTQIFPNPKIPAASVKKPPSPAQSFYSSVECPETQLLYRNNINNCKCLVDEVIQTYGETRVAYGISCDGQIPHHVLKLEDEPLVEVNHKKICGEEEKIEVRIKFIDERLPAGTDERQKKDEGIIVSEDTVRTKMEMSNQLEQLYSSEESIIGMQKTNGTKDKITSSSRVKTESSGTRVIQENIKQTVEEKMIQEQEINEDKSKTVIESADYNISYGTTDDVIVLKPLVVQEDGKIKIYIPLNSDI